MAKPLHKSNTNSLSKNSEGEIMKIDYIYHQSLSLSIMNFIFFKFLSYLILYFLFSMQLFAEVGGLPKEPKNSLVLQHIAMKRKTENLSHSDKLVTDWSEFNIHPRKSVEFIQPKILRQP